MSGIETSRKNMAVSRKEVSGIETSRKNMGWKRGEEVAVYTGLGLIRVRVVLILPQ